MAKNLIIGIFIVTLISCQNEKQENNWVESEIDLLVEISAFESDNIEFDYDLDNNLGHTPIYVGQLKKSELTENNSFNKKQHYIQLNDKISKLKDVKSFVYCSHCNIGEQIILINADKNTPKDFLTEIESEIFKVGIKKNQIYYLTFNTRKNSYGYNHGY